MKKLLISIVILGLGLAWFVFCPRIVDWPYYRITALEGFKTDTGFMFYRAGMGERAHMPLPGQVVYVMHTNCYPREGNDHQSCRIIAYFENPNDVKVDFADMQFIVRDPDKHEKLYDTRAERPTWRGREVGLSGGHRLIITFEQSIPPSEFEILTPDIVVEDEIRTVAPVRFKHVERCECQFIFANY